MRTKKPIRRISITKPDLLEIVQFSPTEYHFIGNGTGETTLTLWFDDAGKLSDPVRYLVRVGSAKKKQPAVGMV